MPKIAIDIALIPSEEMMEKVIEINKELLKDNAPLIVLDKEKCLPHISLCMGGVDEKDIPEIDKVLGEIASQFSVFDFSAESIHTFPDGLFCSDFPIENNEELQKLHATVMKKMKPFVTQDVTLDMLSKPVGQEELTSHWVKNYPVKSSFENFKPHVTIGFGEAKKPESPIEFTASELALCHLGNYCTCRKVLVSKTLKTPA
jgi:2'-5' RNA ligase